MGTLGGSFSRPRLIVGLGNPGRDYAYTPHNLGFLAIDRLAEKYGIQVSRKDSMALVGSGEIDDKPVILAKPQTYMNRSGASVGSLLEKNGLTVQDLIVIYDDLDLAWTAIRIRAKGSAGGHHGVESIVSRLGTHGFARVRLGIAGYKVGDGAKFVLAPLRRGQKKELDELLDYAVQAVSTIISEGVEKSMTRFNRRARGEKSEEE
jgi:PTH1 family peptidyl-tRNA hydrolase